MAFMSSPSTSSIIHQSLPIIEPQCYPKRLKSLKIGPVVDEVGFPLTERLALRQAWKIIRPMERRIGQDIFYKFLLKHYYAIHKFESDKQLDLYCLHTHALNFVVFVGDLIDEPDPSVFQLMLHENIIKHNCRRVPKLYIKNLLQTLIDYVLDVLHKITSPTLENGFKRLLQKFTKYLEESKCNSISLMFYKRELSTNRVLTSLSSLK